LQRVENIQPAPVSDFPEAREDIPLERKQRTQLIAVRLGFAAHNKRGAVSGGVASKFR